jgi:predicted GIY-YIG superfamily endonuclease
MIKNGQSAAKSLSENNNSYDEGSTTIPRKGSTTQKMLEKVHTKLYSFDTFFEKSMGIYMLYCTSNDKCYIGSALNIKARLLKHTSYLKRNCHHSLKLQRAYNKYSIASFKIGILELCTENELRVKEEKWINHVDSFKNGFNNTNICRVTPSFKMTSGQIKKAILKSQLKVVALNFEGNLEYTFESVSAAARHFRTSSSNISRCCQGKFNQIKDHIFKYESKYDSTIDNSYTPEKRIFTQEHKNKIGLANKGKKNTQHQIDTLISRSSKKIKRLAVDSYKEEVYASMKDCCLVNKLYIKTLKKAITAKTSLGGFYYEFVKI